MSKTVKNLFAISILMNLLACASTSGSFGQKSLGQDKARIQTEKLRCERKLEPVELLSPSMKAEGMGTHTIKKCPYQDYEDCYKYFVGEEVILTSRIAASRKISQHPPRTGNAVFDLKMLEEAETWLPIEEEQLAGVQCLIRYYANNGEYVEAEKEGSLDGSAFAEETSDFSGQIDASKEELVDRNS